MLQFVSIMFHLNISTNSKNITTPYISTCKNLSGMIALSNLLTYYTVDLYPFLHSLRILVNNNSSIFWKFSNYRAFTTTKFHKSLTVIREVGKYYFTYVALSGISYLSLTTTTESTNVRPFPIAFALSWCPSGRIKGQYHTYT